MVSRYTQYKIRAEGNGTFLSKNIARGKIHKVTAVYEEDSHADTDLSLRDEFDNVFVVRDNNNTSFTTYPRTEAEDAEGSDWEYADNLPVETEPLVFGRIKLVVADNLADKAVDVYVVVEEY